MNEHVVQHELHVPYGHMKPDLVTIKRTALLMLMCIMAWCLPVKGQNRDVTGGYSLYGLVGDRYAAVGQTQESGRCSVGFPEGPTPRNLYVRFSLLKEEQVGAFQFEVNGKRLDTDGNLWIEPADFIKNNGGGAPYFDYSIIFPENGAIKGKYEYTVSLFENKGYAALAMFHGSVDVTEPIRMSFSKSSIIGEVNTDIPFSVTINAGSDFSGFDNVRLMISNFGSETLTISDGNLMDDNGRRYLPIEKLAASSTYSFVLNTKEIINSNIIFQLETADGRYIPWGFSLKVTIPFNGSPTDIDGLKKIAADNPDNLALKAYIERHGWMEELGNDGREEIGVRWDDSTPARIRELQITNQDTLKALDLSPFTELQSLTLNQTKLKSLDVSMLSKLTSLFIYNTGMEPKDLMLHADMSKSNVYGRNVVEIPFGSPVSGRTDLYETPVGSQADLSAYNTVDGQKTSFVWLKIKQSGSYQQDTIKLDIVSEGIFTLPAKMEENVVYRCIISRLDYPNWTMDTPDIRLTRGAINYSPADIQLLKDLADANKNCKELQEFITAEGWKETWPDNYWQDQNRKVAVDWDFSTPARISKLRVRNMETVTSFDVSAFTELTYLDCYGIELDKLDVSKNTRLKELNVEDNKLVSLDVSKCAKLEVLYCGYNRDKKNNWTPTLESLNINGCTELIWLDISYSRILKALDLGKATKLQNLLLDATDIDVDLSTLNSLESLYIRETTKLKRYAINPPASVAGLYCNHTDYPLLDFAQHPTVSRYGVPRQIKALDVTNSNITYLDFTGSGVLYSTLKANDRLQVIKGESGIPIPGAKLNSKYQYCTIANGDTIDLSSEAVIDGISSVYTWVDRDSQTEVKDAFIPIKEEPGKFVANAKLGKWYNCLISNTKYCQLSEVNRNDGWRLRTYDAVIETPPATYDETEVAALKAIVDASTSVSLKEWWNSKAWQNGGYPDWRFSAWWRLDQETYKLHLEALSLSGLGDSLLTLDVSKFTELMDLGCSENGFTELSVRNNSKLASLGCTWNSKLTTLILPDNKTMLTSLNCENNTELASLDITGYTNLQSLSVIGNNKLTALDVSSNSELKYLLCNLTPIANIDISKCTKLREFGVPSTYTEFDMAPYDSLKVLNPSGSKLKFSTVKLKEGQPWFENYYETNLSITGLRQTLEGYSLIPSGTTIDLSSEMAVNGVSSKVRWIAYDRETGDSEGMVVNVIDNKNGSFTVSGRPNDYVTAIISNTEFPKWDIFVETQIYTIDGDANLDSKVNVRDIAATASEILHDDANKLPYHEFGYYQADVNKDYQVEVADIVGIANLIMGKPVTKSSELRSSLISTVSLTLEEGYLCMQSPVAIAGIQLAFTGMPKAEPLLGKAATFTQGAVAGDTTRILAYSLKGETIPSGTTRLMKMPAGVKLVEAAFSDAQAQSLKVETRGDLATSNEVIRPTSATQQVSNYPNPFRSTTTFVYQLDETADNAYIQVYALNGSLVETIDGLSTQMGENRRSYTTALPAGTYFYRLAIQKQGVTTFSKSNTFIIK